MDKNKNDEFIVEIATEVFPSKSAVCSEQYA